MQACFVITAQVSHRLRPRKILAGARGQSPPAELEVSAAPAHLQPAGARAHTTPPGRPTAPHRGDLDIALKGALMNISGERPPERISKSSQRIRKDQNEDRQKIRKKAAVLHWRGDLHPGRWVAPRETASEVTPHFFGQSDCGQDGFFLDVWLAHSHPEARMGCSGSKTTSYPRPVRHLTVRGLPESFAAPGAVIAPQPPPPSSTPASKGRLSTAYGGERTPAGHLREHRASAAAGPSAIPSEFPLAGG